MEEWKTFERGGITYRINDQGTIIGPRGRVIKTRYNSDGYLMVTLGQLPVRTTYRVHRLVAECFLSRSNDHDEVNHIDFNRSNNSVTNLEWVTHADNVRYSYKRGRHTGSRARERNGRHILCAGDIPKIRKMIAEGVSNIKIGKAFGVAPSTIWNIKVGNTWK